jgi:polysaccharide pyruvyl transferase WcaK-like protein
MISYAWLDLPISAFLDENQIIDIDTRSHLIGANTGNLLFRLGIQRLLLRSFDLGLIPIEFSALSQNPVETVVVSCANWLSAQDTVFDIYAKNRIDSLIKSGVKKTIFVGLGCNSHTPDPNAFTLGPNSLALAEFASSSSKYILTRDTFTTEVLRLHGINNAINTGCPSNLITDFAANHSARKRLLGKAEYLMKSADLMREQFILTQLEVNKPSKKLLECFIQNSGNSNFTYVLQGVSADRLIYESKEDNHISELMEALKDSGYDLNTQIRANPGLFRTFYNAYEWIGFCSGKSFSIGPRLHGAIASLQSGTPAFLCTHDQRTRGLADQLRLPIWDENSFPMAHPVASLEYAIQDYLETQEKQKDQMLHFLSENLQINSASNI